MKKRATWDRVRMKWVKNRRRPNDYFKEAGFNAAMGTFILIAMAVFVIRGS